MARKAATLLKATRLQHVVFGLSFAVASAFVAAVGWPRPWTLGWIIAAKGSAFAAGMAFNRIVDLPYDRDNPRTADRALVTGALRPREMWAFIGAAAGVYFVAAGMLNALCLALSPLALAAALGYSYAKRYTVWTHWALGFVLGLVPPAAWIAVRARLDLAPLALGAAVMLWVAGFDIIYACQDIAFDRARGLFSVPARWGARRALAISAANHFLALWMLVLFGQLADLGWLYFAGLVALAPILYLEHRLVRPDDLSRAEVASFLVNGAFGIGFLMFTAADVVYISSKMRI